MKTKTKKLFGTTIQISLSCIIAYLGVIEGYMWAINLTIFYTWLALFTNIFYYFSGNGQKLRIKQYHESEIDFPLWIDYIVFAYRIILFISFGWWWTGIAWFLTSVFDFNLRDKAKKTPVVNFKLILDSVYNYLTKPENERPEYSYVLNLINDARDSLKEKNNE